MVRGEVWDKKTTHESNPNDLSVNRRRMSGSGIKRLQGTRKGQLSLCI